MEKRYFISNSNTKWICTGCTWLSCRGHDWRCENVTTFLGGVNGYQNVCQNFKALDEFKFTYVSNANYDGFAINDYREKHRYKYLSRRGKYERYRVYRHVFSHGTAKNLKPHRWRIHDSKRFSTWCWEKIRWNRCKRCRRINRFISVCRKSWRPASDWYYGQFQGLIQNVCWMHHQT